MPKPLRSADPQPRDMQFAHFGVLNTGAQSKSSLFTSITVNVILVIIALILGAAAKKTIDRRNKEIVTYAPLEKPPEPIRPKIVPPKIVTPKVVIKPPVPKITMPEVKVIEPPKIQPVAAPKPMPIVTPAPPKVQVAAAAPKVTDVHLGQSASVPNHDIHPAAVSLGQTDNPIHPTNGPAVASVNLGNRGMSGMPPGSGSGAAGATKVSLGSGQPNGQLGGGGPRAVAGVKLGQPGGTGTGPGNGVGTNRVQEVALNHPPVVPTAVPTAVRGPSATPPKVLYKPRPQYTAEAESMHLEGRVEVKVHVSSTGSVTVMGVSNGLGHGLDESAVRAAQGIRFSPARDASGNPVDWDGVVSIIFQIAS